MSQNSRAQPMWIKHYCDYPPMFENTPNSSVHTVHTLKAHAIMLIPKRIGYKVQRELDIHKILVQCSFCIKTYAKNQRLWNHVIIEHENSGKYECGLCHRKLPLKDHMKQVYTKVTCEICEEVQYNWFYLVSERMSCEESAIFFANLAYIPHIRQQN